MVMLDAEVRWPDSASEHSHGNVRHGAPRGRKASSIILYFDVIEVASIALYIIVEAFKMYHQATDAA